MIEADDRFNYILLGTLFPLTLVFSAIALSLTLWAVFVPRVTDDDKMIDRTLGASKALARLYDTFEDIGESQGTQRELVMGETARNLMDDCREVGYFFSPKQVRKRVRGRSGVKLARFLVQAYATADHDALIHTYATCFLNDPAAALFAALGLIMDAKAESNRLETQDGVRAEQTQELADFVEKVVAGTLRSLSGRDDLVDKVISSETGQRFISLSLRNDFHAIAGLP